MLSVSAPIHCLRRLTPRAPRTRKAPPKRGPVKASEPDHTLAWRLGDWVLQPFLLTKGSVCPAYRWAALMQQSTIELTPMSQTWPSTPTQKHPPPPAHPRPHTPASARALGADTNTAVGSPAGRAIRSPLANPPALAHQAVRERTGAESPGYARPPATTSGPQSHQDPCPSPTPCRYGAPSPRCPATP